MHIAANLQKTALGMVVCFGLTFWNAGTAEADNRSLPAPAQKQSSVQENPESPSGFIEAMGQQAIDFLGDSTLSAEQKTQKFNDLLDRNFDMKAIGRFCLGAHWKSLTEEEQAEYQILFKQLIVRIYSSKISKYEGQKFKVEGTQDMPDGDVIVQSLIIPDDGQTIPVDWQVRSKNGGYRIMDVKVEGVSMSITKKSEFSSYILKQGGDPKALLKGLREKEPLTNEKTTQINQPEKASERVN